MTGKTAGEPRYAVRREKVELTEGFAYDVWHVRDLVKERTVDTFHTWGMARSTADALNAGRKTPAQTANEAFAHWA